MGKGLTVTGEIVEVPDDLFDIVGEITYRWPNLWVQYANPDSPVNKRGICLGDAPYRIMERTPNGPVPVFSFWKLDHSVIDRLHMLNSANVDVLAEMDKANAKLKADMQTKAAEELAESADMAQSTLKHFGKGKIKFSYTNEHGEKRVIVDGLNGPDRKTKVL